MAAGLLERPLFFFSWSSWKPGPRAGMFLIKNTHLRQVWAGVGRCGPGWFGDRTPLLLVEDVAPSREVVLGPGIRAGRKRIV